MKRLVAIDPSKWGMGTSGTGIAYAELNGNNAKIETECIFGKNFKNQTEYNIAIEDYLEKLGHIDLLTVEEYRDYNKASTVFQVNGTAEMIGVLKHWAQKNKVPILMRGASQMKTRLPDDIMLEYGWVNKNNEFIEEIIDGTPQSYKGNTKKTKHAYDAFRHLMQTLILSKEGKKLYNEENSN